MCVRFLPSLLAAAVAAAIAAACCLFSGNFAGIKHARTWLDFWICFLNLCTLRAQHTECMLANDCHTTHVRFECECRARLLRSCIFDVIFRFIFFNSSFSRVQICIARVCVCVCASFHGRSGIRRREDFTVKAQGHRCESEWETEGVWCVPCSHTFYTQNTVLICALTLSKHTVQRAINSSRIYIPTHTHTRPANT